MYKNNHHAVQKVMSVVERGRAVCFGSSANGAVTVQTQELRQGELSCRRLAE